MNVRDSMKRNVVYINATGSVRDAVELVVDHHIGTLPVVDDNRKLIGVVKLRTLLSLVMPDFVRLIENFEFVHDFGAVDTRLPTPEDLARPVTSIMEPPIYAFENASLIHAAAILNQQGLKDLPIVSEDGTLAGIASHVDIGISLMRRWKMVPPPAQKSKSNNEIE